MIVYKDYHLENGVLTKLGVNDSKHLMWQFGGVPCIDAENVWDRFGEGIKKIIITTKKGRRFETTGENFTTNKKEINFGFGRQYYLEANLWK